MLIFFFLDANKEFFIIYFSKSISNLRIKFEADFGVYLTLFPNRTLDLIL